MVLKGGLALEHLVQLALGRKLEDQKDALLVVKVAIETQDIGVAKVGLDLNLSGNR